MGVSRGATIEEIGQVYEQRFANFLRTATAIADSTEEGRDAVHDAFVSAVRSRTSYRGSGSVEAWLWRTVVTSALKRRRSGRRTAATDSAPQDAIWTESPAGEYPEVRAAVAGLPERQRHVLFLRYYADLDYRTIGEILDIRIGTVGAELNAAHAALRRQLEVPAS
jgi:RNA polymerase sigma-70 factor, ECF subfamily